MVRKKREPESPPDSDSPQTPHEEKKIVVPPKKRRFADQDPPVSNGSSDAPAADGSNGPPAADGSNGSPAADGSNGPPAADGSNGPPAADGSNDPSASIESNDPPALIESNDSPASVGSNDVYRDGEVLKAYHLDLPPCEPGKCRRNCKANPRCKAALGEKNWLNPKPVAKRKKKEEADEQLLVEGLAVKEEGSFAGLKNLGATCYANCPIQVLNNIADFKLRLFEWKPEEDSAEDATTLLDSSVTGVLPNSVVGSFIYILGMLSSSDRACIDPSPFTDRIGLNTSVQQDSQEFASLLLHRLESDLARQSNPRVRNLCQDLFRGATITVNQCSTCGTVSSGRHENFYSLLINPIGDGEAKGKKSAPPKTLIECLEQSLLPEVLEGENQYFCSNCDCKRDATRKTEITKLPPFLFFQVVRFSFDRTKGKIKKLKDSIEFSNELDLSEYENRSDSGTSLYGLYAVLHHKGQDANSGHYIAHIYQQETEDWVKFNDQLVTKQKYPDFNDGVAKGKKATAVHASSNTYLIVYARKGAVDGGDPRLVESPQWMQKYLNADAAVVKAARELREQEEAKEEALRARKEKIIMDAYDAKETDDWLVVPTSWVSKWLDSDKVCTEFDMKTLLCPHQCLDPTKISVVKCVPKEMAEDIRVDHEQHFVRIGKENLCRTCASSLMKSTMCKETLQKDMARVAEKTKGRLAAGSDDEMYWVGKESWRRWHKMALDKMEKNTVNGASKDVTKTEQNGSGKHEEARGFNDDAACPHGGLIPDEKKRKLVPKTSWDIVHHYFPHSHVFPRDAPDCPECISSLKTEEECANSRRILSLKLKQALGPLISARKKNPVAGKALLLPSEYMKHVQGFIRNPEKIILNSTVDYSSVMCQHGKLRVDPYVEAERNEAFLAVRWEDLAVFEEVLKFTCYVIVTPPADFNGKDVDMKAWTVEPSICEECLAERRLVKEAARYDYECTTIYVQKLELSEKILTILDEDLDEEGNVLLDLNRFSNGESNQLAMLMSLTDPDQSDLRRSGRSKKDRREKEISASSTETLGEFKRKICVMTSVPTSEQKILLGARRLLDDKETLGNLKVPPRAHLVVAHHENLFADIDTVEFPPDERPIETGFQGTKLVGSP